MNKISHLKPVDCGPDPDIVEALEGALALAKEGKVRDMVVAWLDDEQAIFSSLIGNRMRLVGLVEMVKHRSLKAYYDKQ